MGNVRQDMKPYLESLDAVERSSRKTLGEERWRKVENRTLGSFAAKMRESLSRKERGRGHEEE